MKQLNFFDRDYNETLRRYNFKKPKRKAFNEEFDSTSIYDYKEEKQKDNLQRDQEVPLHQEEPTQEQIPKKIHIPNKKHTKKTNQQLALATNLCGKKVQTHQDDEVRYIFTPIEQNYNSNLKNILFWTSFGEEEKA